MKKNILTILSFSSLLVSLISCSPSSPKLKPENSANYEQQTAAGLAIDFRPKIDILFVMDNSGSMTSHQRNLSNNIDIFLNEISKIKVDYQIGVITTDEDDDGELRGTGYEKIITPTTPGGLTILRFNLTAGTNGSGLEKVFDPIQQALSPSMLSGYNAGFIRPEAYLAVIAITDADDQSEMMTSTTMMNFLNILKGGHEKILSYGIIVPSGVTGCPRDEGPPKKLESFLSMTINAKNSSNIMNLCDPQFGLKLAGFSKDIVKYVSGTVKLAQLPILDSIRVYFGKLLLPPDMKTGWYFEPATNSVVLGSDIVIDVDSPDFGPMRIEYQSAKP